MDWIQIWTIIGVNIALVVGLLSVMMWITSKHDAEMKDFAVRQSKTELRLDSHEVRLNQFYIMFCDLLKETKKVIKAFYLKNPNSV